MPYLPGLGWGKSLGCGAHGSAIRFLMAFSFETERALDGVPLPAGAKLEAASQAVDWVVPKVSGSMISRSPR